MKKRVLTSALFLAAALAVSACGNKEQTGAQDGGSAGKVTDSSVAEKGDTQEDSAQAGDKVKIRYAYWGSTFENEAMQNIARKYESLHPGVEIECIYIPNADYTTKMSAMIASGDEPDIANLFASDFMVWAEQGRLVNIDEWMEKDERYRYEDFIPNCFFEVQNGEIAGRSIANELMQLYYNVDLFQEMGVEPLPANPQEALTWEEFVTVCQKLTVDVNGNNALSPDFDPEKIRTYGIDFQKSSAVWSAFVYQNNAPVLSEDGSEYKMDDPASVEAIQKLGDLINVYHVAPDPLTASSTNMSTTSSLQSKQVAIICDGTWTNLDLSSIDINYDVACLPKMSGEPCFSSATSVCSIFNTCENVDVAWDFYMFLADPDNAIELYSSGLWMPLMIKYYEDEELIAKWADPETTSHTDGFRECAVEYTKYPNKLNPETCVIGWTKLDAVISSALDSVWMGEKTAQEVLTEIKPSVEELVKGYIKMK